MKLALSLGLLALLCGVAPLCVPAPRATDVIIAEHDAVKYPGFIDNISLADYRALLLPPSRTQCDTAKELFEHHPDHAQVPRLMRTRWTLLVNVFEEPGRTLSETAAVIRGDHPAALVRQAHLLRAFAGLHDPSLGQRERFAYVREAVKRYPDDRTWCPKLLETLALEHVADPERQRKICELAVDRYGKRAVRARNHLKLLDKIGTKLELQFTDVLTGQPAGLEPGRANLVYIWWPSEKHHARVRALHEVEGMPVLFVYWGGAKDPESVRAAARRAKITKPLWFEGDFEGWAWRLGVRTSQTYLLVDGEGRLVAVTERLAPLLSECN